MTPPAGNRNAIPNNHSTSTTPISRARVACKACNARRVRCDAAEGQPCWHCRVRQTPCELIESKRGKYVRKRPRLSRASRPSHRSQEADNPHTRSPALDNRPLSDEVVASEQSTPSRPSLGTFPRPILPRQAQQDEAASTPTPVAQHRTANESESSNNSGDPSGVSYIVEVVYTSRGGIPRPLKVHYPIPASIADRSVPSHGSRVQEPLSIQEALGMPPREVSDQLVQTFFRIVHPAYPVFDRSEFCRKYLQGEASPMVLHSMFLLAFTMGSEDLVHAAGYSDRATARKTHYFRAKTLFDSDYDGDRLNIAAVLLLLGFWWTSPEDQKNNCYWVTCAVTVAQTSGMHRSASSPAMDRRTRSLRKRVWWSIYIRDRHTSAAFGRPCRIRDEDCDVEPLNHEDFAVDNDYDTRLIPAQEDFHVSYALQMANLAVILGDILVGEFSPRREPHQKYKTEVLVERLMRWESDLPDSLRRVPPDGSMGPSFWANVLHFAYQNYYILLFRPKTIDGMSSVEAERDARARLAADSITRMAEDLLATGGIHSTHIHIVPALFGALSIHTLVICRKDPIHQQLAENKARQCILALSVLAKSWPVKNWIAKAHVNLMRRLTGQDGSSSGSIVDVSSTVSGGGRDITASDLSETTGQQPQTPSSRAYTYDEMAELPPLSDPKAQLTWDGRFPIAEEVPQGADQFVYDSLTAGYLDNIFDIDMFLRNGLGTPSCTPPPDA